MKAKLFILLMALFVFGGIVKADNNFRSLSATFHVDHGENHTHDHFSFKATGSEEVVIEEPVQSLTIMQMTAWWDGGDEKRPTDVKFCYTVYNTLEGGPSENSVWKSCEIPFTQNGELRSHFWEEYPPYGIEFIEEEWLNQNLTKTVMFYVEGKDEAGNTIYCNNGGENYKVTFTIGEGADRIKFSDNAASVSLNYYPNGEVWQPQNIYYRMNKNGGFLTETDYLPTDNLGPISSRFFMNEIHIVLRHDMDIELDDIKPSFFYKIYEEGHGGEVDWTQIDLEEDTSQDNWAQYKSPLGKINLTEGLELNKNYVLEAYFQVIAGKECYIYGKKKDEGSQMRFTLVEEQLMAGPLKNIVMAYSWNYNEVEYTTLLANEYPETVIQEPVYSFRILGLEAVTEEWIHDLRLIRRIYDADMDLTYWNIWEEVPLTDYGFGMWSLDYSKIEEIIKMDWWREENTRLCLEFFFEGLDQNDEYIRFDNDGENYKFTFTCGEDTSIKGIKDFTLTINVNGEVIPVPVPETDGEDSEIPFPLYLLKIMKAEIKTDKPMKHITFFSTLYNTADGPSYDQDAWEMTNFKQQAENTWVVDYQFGKELIEDEWLLQNTRMQKTYQFFVVAEDTEGKEYMYNNGDEFYKFHFTCDDADGISLTPNPSPVGEGSIYNLSGQRLQKAQKGINIIGGKKVLVK